LRLRPLAEENSTSLNLNRFFNDFCLTKPGQGIIIIPLNEITLIKELKRMKQDYKFKKIHVDAKTIIAVGSGKGGVGKSTVTVNLALAMAKKGLKVGLLDADIYGPNVPLMLGIGNTTIQIKNEKLVPIERLGLKVMSVAFITDPDKALIWRGPLANKLIEQFLGDVEWGQLDALLIDLPPGTGDVPLSIIQKAELGGGIIVTTPQEAAIADVQKMIDMFRMTGTKILGIVENMKYVVCPDCNKKINLYPNNDNRSLAKILGYNLLAEFPFEPGIGLKKDDGTPYYLYQTGNANPTVDKYNALCENVVKEFKQLKSI
jgi:ATP-binding protein involved in chromosome partitioning